MIRGCFVVHIVTVRVLIMCKASRFRRQVTDLLQYCSASGVKDGVYTMLSGVCELILDGCLIMIAFRHFERLQ